MQDLASCMLFMFMLPHAHSNMFADNLAVNCTVNVSLTLTRITLFIGASCWSTIKCTCSSFCDTFICVSLVQVVVVGNPANTNAMICSKCAPSIPKANFTCLTRLDQNRAQAQVYNIHSRLERFCIVLHYYTGVCISMLCLLGSLYSTLHLNIFFS